jgi:hypothetical protein
MTMLLWTRLAEKTKADPSLTTPKLKKTFGAPCAQDDTIVGEASFADILRARLFGCDQTQRPLDQFIRYTPDSPGGVYSHIL